MKQNKTQGNQLYYNIAQIMNAKSGLISMLSITWKRPLNFIWLLLEQAVTLDYNMSVRMAFSLDFKGISREAFQTAHC